MANRESFLRSRAFGCVVILLVVFSHAAWAGEEPLPAPQAFQFKQGTWELSVIGGAYLETFEGNGEVLSFAGFDVEYFAWDDVAIVTQFLGYHVEQQEPDAAGFGFNLLLRWYFYKPCESFAAFVEGGSGILETNYRVPTPDGTHHNFTEYLGLGCRMKLADHISLITSVRYIHLSNAYIHGEERNPSIDGFGGFGGIRIDF